MRYAAALVLVVFTAGVAVAADDLNTAIVECIEASLYGNYDAAVTRCTKAAERGHYKAQYSLGKMLYAAGKGVPEDYVQAYKWVVLASVGTPDTSLQAVDTLLPPAPSEVAPPM